MSIELPPTRSSNPEDYQDDEAIWDLIANHESDLKALQEYYTQAKAKNDSLREDLARSKAEIDALEERFLKKYEGNESALAIVRERVQAARDADAFLAENCTKTEGLLAKLLETRDDLNEKMAGLHARMKKDRN